MANNRNIFHQLNNVNCCKHNQHIVQLNWMVFQLSYIVKSLSNCIKRNSQRTSFHCQYLKLRKHLSKLGKHVTMPLFSHSTLLHILISLQKSPTVPHFPFWIFVANFHSHGTIKFIQQSHDFTKSSNRINLTSQFLKI